MRGQHLRLYRIRDNVMLPPQQAIPPALTPVQPVQFEFAHRHHCFTAPLSTRLTYVNGNEIKLAAKGLKVCSELFSTSKWKHLASGIGDLRTEKAALMNYRRESVRSIAA